MSCHDGGRRSLATDEADSPCAARRQYKRYRTGPKNTSETARAADLMALSETNLVSSSKKAAIDNGPFPGAAAAISVPILQTWGNNGGNQDAQRVTFGVITTMHALRACLPGLAGRALPTEWCPSSRSTIFMLAGHLCQHLLVFTSLRILWHSRPAVSGPAGYGLRGPILRPARTRVGHVTCSRSW